MFVLEKFHCSINNEITNLTFKVSVEIISLMVSGIFMAIDRGFLNVAGCPLDTGASLSNKISPE